MAFESLSMAERMRLAEAMAERKRELEEKRETAMMVVLHELGHILHNTGDWDTETAHEEMDIQVWKFLEVAHPEIHALVDKILDKYGAWYA